MLLFKSISLADIPAIIFIEIKVIYIIMDNNKNVESNDKNKFFDVISSSIFNEKYKVQIDKPNNINSKKLLMNM